jgi:hypothetical protein
MFTCIMTDRTDVVQKAVAKVASEIMLQGAVKWPEIMARLSQLDWRLSSPPWEAGCNVEAARMVGAKENNQLLAELLHVHLARPASRPSPAPARTSRPSRARNTPSPRKNWPSGCRLPTCRPRRRSSFPRPTMRNLPFRLAKEWHLPQPRLRPPKERECLHRRLQCPRRPPGRRGVKIGPAQLAGELHSGPGPWVRANGCQSCPASGAGCVSRVAWRVGGFTPELDATITRIGTCAGKVCLPTVADL